MANSSQYASDALAIKTKLEQEALRYAATLAEKNSELSRVEKNIELYRTRLDEAARRRSFCLAANNCYNELTRLECLERERKASSPIGTRGSYGFTNEEERQAQIQLEDVKEREVQLYKASCLKARDHQKDRNEVWSQLEALMQQREASKEEVKKTEALLLILRRSTGTTSIRRTSSATSTSDTGSRDVLRSGIRHARQLSSEDRECWRGDTNTEDETFMLSLVEEVEEGRKQQQQHEEVENKTDMLLLPPLTKIELKELREQYREIPEWCKVLTLIKLKHEVDQRLASSNEMMQFLSNNL